MATAASEITESPATPDLQLVDKTFKRLNKLYRLCTDPRLGLRNSPPNLPDLVSNTSLTLKEIWDPYRTPDSQQPRGEEARYLRIHIRNLLDKTERALQLFKEGHDQIFDESSSCRRNLTKLTLLFSHMLWELKAMFPEGYFQGHTYRLTKKEADEFWRESFGAKCIVPWSSFEDHLRKVHTLEKGIEAIALKSTIDLTCNNYVSVFEFDTFTRLFQPFKSLIKNWNQLAVTHPGYMAFLTYDQVTDRLENYLHKPGSYIFRLSCTRMGQWAIGHVTPEGDIVQTIPENTPLFQALIQGFNEGCYVYPDGEDVNPDLTSLREAAQRSKVKVTEEQYNQYTDIGTTFQLCKICSERDKDIRVEPCGHLMCQPCFSSWQKSAGHTCPYCRCNILGKKSVLIEPYQPAHQDEEDDEEEDHEDIESLVKQMAAMRTVQRSDQPHNAHRKEAINRKEKKEVML
ncbi:E3 ubiquitin-protein ligase CBL-C [Neosynchiropus ocellatus]